MLKKSEKINYVTVLLMVVVVGLNLGCHRHRNDNLVIVVPEQARPSSIVELPISRKQLQERISSAHALNQVRLVEVYNGGGDRPPRYRLFDVKRGSVCELLGLSNADVIVALDQYYFYKPEKFGAYIELMQKLKNASITIEKNGQPLLMRYKIVEG